MGGRTGIFKGEIEKNPGGDALRTEVKRLASSRGADPTPNSGLNHASTGSNRYIWGGFIKEKRGWASMKVGFSAGFHFRSLNTSLN